MKLTWIRALVIGSLAIFAAPAATLNFYTGLRPEVAGATGFGFATFTLDTIAETLLIETSWNGLSGTTTVAHIHCCVATPGTGTVGVAVTPGTLPGFPAGFSEGDYSVTIDLSLAASFTNGFRGMDTPQQATARLVQGILDNRAYLNIHSTAFPGGEIRGFLKPVPEPATFAMAGAALAVVVALRRRR